jgi:hypothetical protein
MFCVLPLFFKATLDPTATNILGYGTAIALFGLGIASLAQGLKHQALYDAATVGRAPLVPFKLAGSGIIGLAAAGLTWFQGGSFLQAGAVLGAMTALCALAFGRDPSLDKGLETAQQRHDVKLDEISARTGAYMERVREAAAIHGDPDVMPRVRALDDAVDGLLRAAMRDPERVGGLRKFFGVYLEGTAEASERFAAVYSGTGDPYAKQKYVALLEKLTRVFRLKTHDYAKAGTLKLDVQIDVLDTSLTQDTRGAA